MKPLYPIMAVLLAASAGLSPLRARAGDGAENPLNTLTAIFKDPAQAEARKDASARVKDFLFDADDSGNRFVSADLKTDRLVPAALKWGEVVAKPDELAVLYFVIGPKAVTPTWVPKDSILAKTLKPGMQWNQKLRNMLGGRKIDGKETDPEAANWTQGAQIKTDDPTRVSAFLVDAVNKAGKVFADQRTKKEISDSVTDNDVTAPVITDTSRNPNTKFDGAGREYTLDDLYRDGAVVVDVAGPKDANSRKISMKMFTRREGNQIIDEIAIFDITDSNDIFGQRFPITSANQSFILDDRTPGHKKYELKFGPTDKSGNRPVHFGRPDGGPSIETSVSNLFLKRADQASRMGNIVRVNGEDFYTLPQGGARGGLVLFPKGVVDGRGTGDARDLVPQLYAETTERGSNGRSQNVRPGENGGPELGIVGDKHFHLVWNARMKTWDVVEGAGDVPAPPSASTGDGTNPSAPGTNPAGPGGGGPAGGYSIADLINTFFKDPIAKGICKINPDDTKDIVPSLKGKYGVVTCTYKVAEGPQQIILVPKSETAKDQQVQYGSAPGFKLLRARLVDHFVVLVFDKQIQYLDLLKQDSAIDPQTKTMKPSGFAFSGYVDENKHAEKFETMSIFVDALRNYMGIKAGSKDEGAFTAVPERVKQNIGSKPFIIKGQYNTDEKTKETYLLITAMGDGQTFSVWPELQTLNGAAKPTAGNPYAKADGVANWLDSVSSVSDVFPAMIDLEQSHQAKVMAGRSQKDIAMYESVDIAGQKEPKKYYLMYKFNALDPKDPTKPDGEKEAKIFRQKPFEIFNDKDPLPAGDLVIAGLLNRPVIDDRVRSGAHFIPGSTPEKGVFAVFQNKQVSAENAKKGSANCVGPLVWWGVDEKDALQACKDDKL